MAAIVANAEVGTNYYQQYDFIRDFTPKPLGPREAAVGCVAQVGNFRTACMERLRGSCLERKAMYSGTLLVTYRVIG